MVRSWKKIRHTQSLNDKILIFIVISNMLFTVIDLFLGIEGSLWRFSLKRLFSHSKLFEN